MKHPVALIVIGLVLLVQLLLGQAEAAPATQPDSLVAGALFPAVGAKEVCVDTPLRITFNRAPELGEGRVQVIDASDHSVVQSVDVGQKTAEQSIGGVPHFKYHPVIISGNDATIYLPNGSLAYHKTYDVTVDAGAFKSDDGGGMTGLEGWQFTTKVKEPDAAAARLIVAADGTGDFCSIQRAIDSVPEGNAKRITVFVRSGVYSELINFRKKGSITITGEDRKKTVIAYANNAMFNPSSEQGYHRGVFEASGCDGLVVSNLTIRNTTRRGGSQAEAVILNGGLHSKAILANIDLYSFQDTLQINGQAYISNCYIEGDVDFMWGRGPCFFENCHCFATRSKAFYAQVRNPGTNHGFVYHRCVFDGPEGVKNMYLNRIAPGVYPHSEMVLMDCELGPAVAPAGWLLNAAARGTTAPTAAPDVHFWEYNSHDHSGALIDTSRRLDVSRQLKSPADAELIVNYSQPGFVLGDQWDAQSDPNLPGP